MLRRMKTPAEVYEEFFVPGLFGRCTSELLDLVPPRAGERVLDLGCGSGIVARTVAPLVGSSGTVAAVDIRPGMLAVAAAQPDPGGALIDWHEGDALALDFDDASFDLVLCQQGLQYFPSQSKALDEMRRVVTPGGRVGLAVWQGLDRHDLFRALTEAEVRHLSVVGVTYEDAAAPFLRGDPDWLREAVADAGLGDVQVEERSFEARFPSPETFVANLEFAYSAVIPEFSEDPEAFDSFVASVASEVEDLVARHTEGDEVVIPMHVNVAVATAPGR